MIKSYFRRPRLLGVGKNLPERSASPLELFFDLVFVVSMAHLIVVLETNISFQTITYVILKYITVYIYWIMIVKYNQYFEDNTPVHRLIMLVSMIPILLLTIGNEENITKYFTLYLVAFILSRIMILLIWIWSTYKVNENFTIKKLITQYYVVYSHSILVVILCSFLVKQENTFLWLVVFVYILAIEIIYPIIKIKSINSTIDYNDDDTPVLDRKLQQERMILFTILILGEGLVGTSVLINSENNVIFSTFCAVSLLITTFSILWLIIDYYASHNIKYNKMWSYNYLTLFTTLAIFLILGGVITLFTHPTFYSKLLISFGMILFAITSLVMPSFMDEFIYEKYKKEEKDKMENIKKIYFKKYSKIFYLNLFIGILLLFLPLKILMIGILINIILIINVVLLIVSTKVVVDKN